jgi:hypothetical protein
MIQFINLSLSRSEIFFPKLSLPLVASAASHCRHALSDASDCGGRVVIFMVDWLFTFVL